MIVQLDTKYTVLIDDNINEARKWLSENSMFPIEKQRHTQNDSYVLLDDLSTPYSIYEGVEFTFKEEEEAENFAFMFNSSVSTETKEYFEEDDLLHARDVLFAYLDKQVEEGADPNELYYGKREQGKHYERVIGGVQSEATLEKLIEEGVLQRPISGLQDARKEWFEEKIHLFPREIENRERKKEENLTEIRRKNKAQKNGNILTIVIYGAWLIGGLTFALFFSTDSPFK